MRILVTRPLEDGADIAARLAALGHETLLAPLLAVHFHDGPALVLDDVQAILATSANGIRALTRRTARRDVAIFAVGPQTAQAAQSAGFSNVQSANGDARALAEAAGGWATPARGALLHVCGEDAPGALAQNLTQRGFSVRRAALYRVTAAAALPKEAAAALQNGTVDAALFFSPRSAAVFCDLATGLKLEKLIALCISAATAQALTSIPWRQMRIAAQPNQDAMLALVE